MVAYVTLLWMCFLNFNRILGDETPKDYCAHEYFNPQCPDGHVIVIKKALFGRMVINRCLQIEATSVLKGDPKYFGCSSDVSDILTDKCSGLQRCNIHVTDPDLLKKTNCYKDMTSYLNAEYSCYNVYRSDFSCSITLAEETISILNFDNFTKSKLVCGTQENPWHIETSVGQTIEISMLFLRNHMSRYSPETSKHLIDRVNCNTNDGSNELLASIFQDEKHNYTICKGQKTKAKILTSLTNKVSVVLSNQSLITFILSFKATGCYDLKPPQDAWMKREGNELTVGCYMNRHSWKLVCNGKYWVGVIGNCSQQYSEVQELKEKMPRQFENKLKNSEEVFAILVVVSLAVLLLLAISCGFLIFSQRLKSKNIKFGRTELYIENKDQFLNEESQTQKVQNGKLESSRPDPSYYVLENDDGNEINGYKNTHIDILKK